MGRIHLGRILGTSITLDFSFLILIALFVITNMDARGLQFALLWAPVLLISILFHELAHAATIGLLGFGPSAIILGGIGGVTINQRRAKPWQDLLISAAGPASSFLLAFLISLLPTPRDPFLAAFFPLLGQMNILWGFFNLLPVGPLDGAQAFRNFLRLFLPEQMAFMISVWTSIVAGILVGIYGLVTREYFLLLLMFWFVRSSYGQWQLFRASNRPDD